MPDKQHFLSTIRAAYDRWQALLAELDEDQLSARCLPADLSIKDVAGHLRAWQEISIARLEAMLDDREPSFPPWLGDLEPDADENLERINAWIHTAYRDQPWPAVHDAWQSGFLRFLTLAAAIPEGDMFDTDRYPWMSGYAAVEVLQGSYEHHEEHYAPLPALLAQLGWIDG